MTCVELAAFNLVDVLGMEGPGLFWLGAMTTLCHGRVCHECVCLLLCFLRGYESAMKFERIIALYLNMEPFYFLSGVWISSWSWRELRTIGDLGKARVSMEHHRVKAPCHFQRSEVAAGPHSHGQEVETRDFPGQRRGS